MRQQLVPIDSKSRSIAVLLAYISCLLSRLHSSSAFLVPLSSTITNNSLNTKVWWNQQRPSTKTQILCENFDGYIVGDDYERNNPRHSLKQNLRQKGVGNGIRLASRYRSSILNLRRKPRTSRLHSFTPSSDDEGEVDGQKQSVVGQGQGQGRQDVLKNKDALRSTHRTSFTLTKPNQTATKRRPLLRRILKPWRRKPKIESEDLKYKFGYDYDYDQLEFRFSSSPRSSTETVAKTTMVLLIQPIGVGIGRWYYDRLLDELASRYGGTILHKPTLHRFVFVVPDLLGCGSASNPSLVINEARADVKKLPLLSVDDWSDQLMGLVSECESEQMRLGDEVTGDVSWCVLSNGGCTSIALEVAGRLSAVGPPVLPASPPASPRYPLTHLVLSATPSAESLLSPVDLPKIERSYRTLSRRAVGGLFWCYSLSNEGAFIRKFSEKNLVARPENLGEGWQPRCYETAKAFGGKSRYSTFAFLAGSLNGGSRARLEELARWNEGGGSDGEGLGIGIIIGGEMKGKAARSWFWKRRPKAGKDKKTTVSMTYQTITANGYKDDSDDSSSRHLPDESPPPRATFTAYLQQNGFRCKETVVGGRVCLAHEDAEGYARAVMGFLMD